MVATAELLSAEPSWLHHAARLRAEALDVIAEPGTLVADVRVLADLTEGRPTAVYTAAETLRSRTGPIAPESLRAAATDLADDPRASAGILAVALAAVAGASSGWDPGWRGVVGVLRAHPDPDVAAAALELRMG